MIVQSRVERRLPYDKVSGTQARGNAWKDNRSPQTGSRLYPFSPRNALFLLSFVLLCSGVAIQYTTGVNIFFKKSITLVHADQPTSVNPVSGPTSATAPSTPTDKRHGPKQGSFSEGTKVDSKKSSRNPTLPADVVKPGPPSKKVSIAPQKSEESLAAYLNFSSKTTLNFMHFHKTGGVSFKIALFAFFKSKKKRNGELVKCRDSCYDAKPPLQRWRCDWKPVWAMNEAQRNKLDVIFGHQYWMHGAQDFLTKRDLRTFTVMRHPFDRKVSFFFHFMVREAKRDERAISFDEVRDFILYDKSRYGINLGRDVGPNYMAGRLLSDGRDGYVGTYRNGYYAVKKSQEKQIAEKALKILRKYIFIGMQSESPASKCMLRKTIEVFNAAHGIDNAGTEKVAGKIPVANSGSYTLKAPNIWERLSTEEKKMFNKKEQVDLAIYYEGVRMFQQHVKRFKCEHLVKNRRYDYRA